MDIVNATLMHSELSRLYVCADPHFFHENIITHCNRPFETVEEMNEAIVESWNQKIPVSANNKPPIVFLLGDVVYGKRWTKAEVNALLARLNGAIYLIEGNHDRQTKIARWSDRFDDVFTQLEVKFFDPLVHPERKWRMVLNHYRLSVWNQHNHGSWHIHGHSHGTYEPWPTLDEIELLQLIADSSPIASADHVKPVLERLRMQHNVRALDAAWDTWKEPLSYAEIRAWMAVRSYVTYDHHTEKTHV